jgi:hypothetical protein
VSRERWFSGHSDAAAFDWRGPANAHGVADDVAHALYVRAMQRVRDVRAAEELYLHSLRDEVAERPHRSPGESRQPPERKGLAPGAMTGVLLAAGRKDPVSTETVGAWAPAPTGPSAWAKDWLATHPPRRGATSGPSVPGRETLVGPAAPHRSGFDDYRALGLQDLLRWLGRDHPLRREVIAAAANADRPIAGRATHWCEPLQGAAGPSATTANGAALWQASERRAVTLYRRAVSDGAVDPHDPSVETALQQRGSGQLLPAELRREMERELGASLAGVRLHTDAVAVRAARAISAEAFTVGEDIFFAEGAFAPDTAPGRKLSRTS